MKCPKCNVEASGRFCNECGCELTPGKCLKCGEMNSETARFCGACGNDMKSAYSEQATKTESTPVDEKMVKLITYLKIIPTAFFMLFSILLFVFFNLAVAIMPGGDFMGETIPNISYGNVYSLMGISELSELQNGMTALIVLTVCGALFAIICSILNINKFKNKQRMKPLGFAEISSFVFYLIIFIAGCIIIGTISDLDGGFGLIESGACPVLMIVFSILFMIFGTGVVAIRFFFAKKYPLADEVKAAKASAVKPNPFIMPEEKIKPQKPDQPLNKVIKVVRIKRKITALLITPLFLLLPILLMLKWFDFGNTRMFFTVIAIGEMIFYFILMWFLLFSKKIKKFNPKNVKVHGMSALIVLATIMVTWWPLSVIMMMFDYFEIAQDSVIPIMIMFIAILFYPILLLILAIVGKNRIKQVREVFYGKRISIKNQEPLVTFE